MKSLVSLVHNWTSWPRIAFFLVPSFLVQYLLIAEYLPDFLQFSQSLKNPDQLFSYDKNYLENLYQNLGQEGSAFYQGMLRLDYLYLSLAAIGYVLLIAKLERHGTILIVIPVLMGIFDTIENSCQLFLLHSYPSLPTTWVNLSSLASSLKMSLSMIAVLYILFLLIKRLWEFFKRQLQSASSNQETTEN